MKKHRKLYIGLISGEVFKMKKLYFAILAMIALSGEAYADQIEAQAAAVASESHNSPKLFFAIFLFPAICVACLPGRQQRFHFYYRFFTWVAISMLALNPLFIVFLSGSRPMLSDPSLIESTIWFFSIALLLLYSNWRCTSERLSYLDGLMFTMASVTGLTRGVSIVVGVPLLIIVIIASVLLSLFNDLARRTKFTPEQFQKLIGRIYKNRMRQ